MVNSDKLTTVINTDIVGNFDYSQDMLFEKTFQNKKNKKNKDDLNKICEKLNPSSLTTEELRNSKKYNQIIFSDYMKFKRNENDKLIYRVEKKNEDFTINTGLYCGVLNLKKNKTNIQLIIETEYSKTLLKRMLNYCCGVFADINTTEKSSDSESIYSLLVQYLFLISLRNMVKKIIPQKYVKKSGRDYNLKGDVDINKFVNYDILCFDKKLSYNYSEQIQIQKIIDVLYIALKECKIDIAKNSFIPDVRGIKIFLYDKYSGIRPSKNIITNILKEQSLKNSIYSDFKKPLKYAQYILLNKDLNSGETTTISGVSGYLVDASFLWEMYLFNLLKSNLPDWDINAQVELKFYEDTFFSKSNYPDFVLTNKNTGAIFILDAKFKKMKFDSNDVDNDDLRQIHCYSYYYTLKEKEKFKGAGLIYPTINGIKKDGKNQKSSMYGLPGLCATLKFRIFYLEDIDEKNENDSIIDKEKEFLDAICSFLE